MPTYLVNIAETGSGTYTKVRKLLTSALGKDAVEYNKPVFSVSADESAFAEVRAELVEIEGIVIEADDGVPEMVLVDDNGDETPVEKEEVEEAAPAAVPEPAPGAPVAVARPTPGLPSGVNQQLRRFMAQNKQGRLEMMNRTFVINTSRGGLKWCAHLRHPEYAYLGEAPTCRGAVQLVKKYLINHQ